MRYHLPKKIVSLGFLSRIMLNYKKKESSEFGKKNTNMVKEDLERWQKWEKGESFPWDANNYTNENKMLFRRYNKI